MPPKIDPYATPRARIFDILLILFAISVIAILIFTSPRHRSRSESAPARVNAQGQHAANASLPTNDKT